MEETISFCANAQCIQSKRGLSPRSGHEPRNFNIYIPRNKVLGLGFIDVKEPNVEKPEEVAKRIRRVLDTGIVTPERLLVMPDCGLGYMSRTVAEAKLSAMGAGVKMVREGL